MRCLACGAEMQLVEVIQDHTMLIRGYEQHAFECPECHDVERRLAFQRDPSPPVPPTRSASVVCTEPAGTVNAWARAVARLRNHQIGLQEQAAVVRVRCQFNHAWDHVTSQTQTAAPVNLPTRIEEQSRASQKDRSPYSAALLGALTDVIASLRNQRSFLRLGPRDEEQDNR
jgi:hypothetical protein